MLLHVEYYQINLDRQTDGRTGAMTIPVGQNWPRVKIHYDMMWPQWHLPWLWLAMVGLTTRTGALTNQRCAHGIWIGVTLTQRSLTLYWIWRRAWCVSPVILVIPPGLLAGPSMVSQENNFVEVPAVMMFFIFLVCGLYQKNLRNIVRSPLRTAAFNIR